MSVQGIHTRSSISLACLLVTAPAVFADQVDMQNGDHYNGKVLSLSSDTLLLHNDNLGTIRLPRSKVAAISLGSNSVARVAAPAGAAPAALPVAPKLAGGGTAIAGNNLDSSLRSLRMQTNLVDQVQKQLLEGAGPGATTKFNEMLDGLNSGKISISDLRKQAQSAAAQLRAFKKESGDDSSDVLDGYLSILDQFLKETDGTH